MITNTLKNTTGTTLVEVMVSSVILVGIVGLLTTALSSIFVSYETVRSSSQVDQTSQYITNRLAYAASQHDPFVVVFHSTPEDFQSQSAVFQGSQTVRSDGDGEIDLVPDATTGIYTSGVVTMSSGRKIKSLMSNLIHPISTTVGYQVAVRTKTVGICPTDINLYEFDLTKNPIVPGTAPSSGDGAVTDLITALPVVNGSNLYTNPGDCLVYKIHLTRPDSSTQSPKILDITITSE